MPGSGNGAQKNHGKRDLPDGGRVVKRIDDAQIRRPGQLFNVAQIREQRIEDADRRGFPLQ